MRRTDDEGRAEPMPVSGTPGRRPIPGFNGNSLCLTSRGQHGCNSLPFGTRPTRCSSFPHRTPAAKTPRPIPLGGAFGRFGPGSPRRRCAGDRGVFPGRGADWAASATTTLDRVLTFFSGVIRLFLVVCLLGVTVVAAGAALAPQIADLKGAVSGEANFEITLAASTPAASCTTTRAP